MRLLRHKEHADNRGNMTGVRRGMLRALAAVMFCLVLSIGTVCYADEVSATVTVASAKIRASADPASQQLGSAKQGGTVSIVGQTTGTDGKTWYQVFVDANTKGFIRADLVNVTGSGTINQVSSDASAAASTTTTTATATDTQVSATDKKSGTVQTNNVRIRKGASTTADVVATANRGMVVTVTGEAAGDDGKTWYQISFTYNSKEITGFIRSDLVTFDALPADSAQTTINGTTETPEEPATETTTEETTEPVTEEQPQEQESSTSNDTQDMILMNVDDVPYILPEFNPIILKWEDQDINAYKNGDFYLFYAQKQNGEEGWYIFDSVNGVYERYVYSTAGATVPETSAMSGNMLPVIILAVIIVILLIAIILMFMKLREYTGEYEEYEDDEEDDEYGDEEEDAEEEEELIEEPVRRQPQQPRRQPMQQPRPQPQQPVRSQEPREDAQPVRRPQPTRRPQGEEQRTQQPPRRQEAQPARRPQQQGQPVRRQEGEAPVRRQPQQSENGRPVNRQPQGNPNRRPAQPRPENQPQRNVQQGRKAKNFLDSEDDDMEFIDI